MTKTAIIVAGGSGLRAGGEVPKQLQFLNGEPVFAHSIRAFLRHDRDTRIILVVNKVYTDMFRAYIDTMQKSYAFDCMIVEGGVSRAHSVLNALKALKHIEQRTDMLVAIHDAARPLVSEEIIARGWMCAHEKGAAVPVIPLTDSIRHLDTDTSSHSVPRAEYVAVQTPQIFRAHLLLQAYSLLETGEIDAAKVTDDASVAELAGHKVSLYPGELKNIKITDRKSVV